MFIFLNSMLKYKKSEKTYLIMKPINRKTFLFDRNCTKQRIYSLFGAFLLMAVSAGIVLAEAPQITIVEGEGTFSQTQSPATTSTDLLVSGHLVGETTQADILPGETWNVRFANPNDSLLLRVLDQSGTRIWGELNIFNGRFVLMNVNGIDIASSARINVNSGVFVASAMDIDDRDFVNGKYDFGGSAGKAGRAVTNRGLIRTTGSSSVVLLGQGIANSGTIEASLGRVALACGDAVSLALDESGLISVDVTEPVSEAVSDLEGNSLGTQVSNTGTIAVDGGVVLIDAKALNGIFDRSVNLEGVIRANKAVEGPDGIIRIVASDKVVATGRLEARYGKISLFSQGLISLTGTLIVENFLEEAFAFRLGGTVEVGLASMINLDGAVTLLTGDYSGTLEDAGDIIVDVGAQINLTGATVFWADSDLVTHAHDGNGVFTMSSSSWISGGGNSLTLYSAGRDSTGVNALSVLSWISGVSALELNASAAGTAPVYTLLENISSAGTFNIYPDVTFDAAGHQVTVEGLATVFGGEYRAGTGLQVFDGGLTVSGGVLDASSGAGQIEINGDLLLASGATLLGGGRIFITGDWTNNGGTFLPGTGTVTFLGAAADQQINGTAGTQTFYDVVMAKGDKTLSVGGATTVLVMHNLALESGIFHTGTAALINITGNVVFSSSGISSFNGLTIDADTFTVGDVPAILGDTARTYYPITDQVLDAILQDGQVKTLIIGIPYDQDGYNWLANYWGGAVPSGSNRVNMTDNNYNAYLAHVRDRISAAGSDIQLIVEFGNEYNLHPEWFGGDLGNWFSALASAVSNVRSVFGSSILISTSSGDVAMHFVQTIQTGVDLVGMNSYRGLGNIRSLVTDWQAACTAAGIDVPLYISETGYPSWPVDGWEEQQAINVPLLWEELIRNGLGVTFMSFEDNWRKGGSPVLQDNREDFWGWLRQDASVKPVYETMALAWSLPEFRAGSANINVGGNWTNNGGIFTAGSSTVTFDASDAGHVIAAGASAFNNVVFDSVGGAWAVMSDTLRVNGNLSIVNGQVTLDQPLSVGGDVNLSGGELDSAGQAVSLEGSWVNNGGTFDAGNGTVTFGATDSGHVLASGTSAFYDVVFNGVGGVWEIVGNDLQVDGDFSLLNGRVVLSRVLAVMGDINLSGGELDSAGQDITLGGSWVNNGGRFEADNGTVTFGATDSGHVIAAGASAFNDVVFNGVGGAWAVMSDLLQIAGDILIVNGRVTLERPLSVGGDVNLSGGVLDASGQGISLAGDWNNFAQFIHGGNTVTLSGDAQTVRGSNIFYNLAKTGGTSLFFPAGISQTIDGRFTLHGEAGSYLLVSSDSDGLPWMFSAGSADINRVELKDTKNTGSVIRLFSFLDSGNNTGFVTGVELPWWDVLDMSRLTAASFSRAERRISARLFDPTLLLDERHLFEQTAPEPVILTPDVKLLPLQGVLPRDP